MHTNTTPTVITHSCVLQKPPFCNNNGYKFELETVDQIGTSVSFWPRKGKCWHFEDDCVPNDSTGKVATWGVLIYSWNMTFLDKMQNFFKESSWSALTASQSQTVDVIGGQIWKCTPDLNCCKIWFHNVALPHPFYSWWWVPHLSNAKQ